LKMNQRTRENEQGHHLVGIIRVERCTNPVTPVMAQGVPKTRTLKEPQSNSTGIIGPTVLVPKRYLYSSSHQCSSGAGPVSSLANYNSREVSKHSKLAEPFDSIQVPKVAPRNSTGNEPKMRMCLSIARFNSESINIPLLNLEMFRPYKAFLIALLNGMI
jgi:hypothetical protein